MRAGRLFRFTVIPRFRRLYRCPECWLVTDDPRGHARYHAGQQAGGPGAPEGVSYLEVVIEDRPIPLPDPGEMPARPFV